MRMNTLYFERDAYGDVYSVAHDSEANLVWIATNLDGNLALIALTPEMLVELSEVIDRALKLTDVDKEDDESCG